MGALLNIVVALLIIGVCLWALPQLPLDATIVTLIKVVVIVFVVIWLLQAVTGQGWFPHFR